jgi:hypothetical protein
MKKSKISATDRKGRPIVTPSRFCSSFEENTIQSMANNNTNNTNMEYRIGEMISGLNSTPSVTTNSEEISQNSTIEAVPIQKNVSTPLYVAPIQNCNSIQYSNSMQGYNSVQESNSTQYSNMNTVPAISSYVPPIQYHHGLSYNYEQAFDFPKMLNAIEKVGNTVNAIGEDIKERLEIFEKRMVEYMENMRKELK